MNLFSKFKALFRRDQLDADMAEEMRLHIERRTQVNLAAGMSPDEARYVAQRQFGGVEQLKEVAREQRGWMWLEQILQDARYAAKQLRKAPGFAAVSILTLGLGIGATTAIFSLLNGLLLRPLPVTSPESLVLLRRTDGGESFSYPAFESFRDQTQTMTGVTSIEQGGKSSRMIATGFDAIETESVRTQAVSGNFFSLLGVPAAVGRTMVPDDDRTDAPQAVVVLSHAFWQRRFAGDPEAVGRRIEIEGVGVTIVGVAREGFFGFDRGVAPDLWWPTSILARLDAEAQPPRLKYEGYNWSLVVGRLRAGASREEAQAELQTVFHRQLVEFANQMAWSEQQRKIYLSQRIDLLPGAAGFTRLQRQLASPLTILSVLVMGVLLIACANVAGLLLARGSARQRELALRAALGAGRSRIVRQLVTESLMLAICGGVAGAGLAYVGTKFLAQAIPGAGPALDISIDVRVLGSR